MERIPSSAPVKVHAKIDIAVAEREVWTVIANIASWPTWNPAVRQAVFHAELEVGARFRYSTPFGSMTCRLTEVDAPRALAWDGRLLTMHQGHRWQVDARPDGVHASMEASISGLGARLFRHRLTERLQGEVDALVQLLKLEAEARAAEEHHDPRSTAGTRGDGS